MLLANAAKRLLALLICLDGSSGIEIEMEKSMQEENGADLNSEHQNYIIINPPSEDKILPYLATLAAANIPYHIAQTAAGHEIRVDSKHSAAAAEELNEYERANRDWPPKSAISISTEVEETAIPEEAVVPSLVIVATLVLFFLQVGPYNADQEVFLFGRATAETIRNGQWWRCVTALSLHSDTAHLVGNAAALFLFGIALAKQIGFGVAWLSITLAGAGGNLMSAWIKDVNQASIGASTAVFAALGILTIFQFYRNIKEHGLSLSIWNRTWLPAAAGIAFLTLLSAGARTDIVAHLCGFGVGIIMALPLHPLLNKRVGTFVQTILYLVTFGIFWYSWQLALQN